jgi:hypothetical protein
VEQQNNRVEGERRESFRIEDIVLLDYTVVPAPSAEGLPLAPPPDTFSLLSSFNETHQQARVLARQVEHESKSMLRYFELIERKLDILAEALLMREMNAAGAPQRVDIGADGMAFTSEQPLHSGCFLELKIALLSSRLGLRTRGQVVRVEPAAQGAGHAVGVRFHHPRESDRELLVQHVLRRQAALLRARHGQEDV